MLSQVPTVVKTLFGHSRRDFEGFRETRHREGQIKFPLKTGLEYEIAFDFVLYRSCIFQPVLLGVERVIR